MVNPFLKISNLHTTLNLNQINKYFSKKKIPIIWIAVFRKWALADPIDRDKVDVNYQISRSYFPYDEKSSAICFKVYVTGNDDATYCDEEGVKKLGDFIIDLPDVELGEKRKVYFELSFGEMEIEAYARNEYNGLQYRTTFELEF